MDKDKKLIIENLAEEKVTRLMEAWYKKNLKSSEKSRELREKGNKLYAMSNHSSQDHEKIWKFYSLSIALAPVMSETLAVAYGNRSALLFHLKKYSECIGDIDRALEITCSSSLKTKLFVRKSRCLAELEKRERELALEKNNIMLSKLDLDKKGLSEDSDKDFLDNIEFEELLSKKKKRDPFELVALRHNERYGRHLVASQDIKPGEIIMVIKPYLKCVNMNNAYAFCNHCLKTCWASIPCDQCSLSMYCSKECKKEAWEKYHDIECSVIPYLLFNDVSDYWKQLALRSIIIAIKKNGSISNLEKELIKFEKCPDKLSKGFVNGKLSTEHFASVFNLSCNVSSEVSEVHVDHAVLTLVALAKSTLLFGESSKFKCSKDLISNNEVVFVGLLLLRMMKISDINSHCVMEGSSLCRFSSDMSQCEANRCCERGVCAGTVPSFMNHSCYPNVRKCFTEDMDMIVFALRPIKKNSQLFDSYVGCFFGISVSQRQKKLENFNFKCTCPACKNNWPILMLNMDYYLNPKEVSKLELKLFNKYQNIIYELDKKIEYSWTTIKCLSKDIEEASIHLTQPNFILSRLISALWTAFDEVCVKKSDIITEYKKKILYN